MKHGALAALLVAAYGALVLGGLVPWHDAILWPLVAGVIAYRSGARTGVLAALAVAGLGIDLASLWSAGFAGRNHVFAGIFALSDAQEYWLDAERVLHGVPMISGGARRPLFAAVLAGVLDLVGNDIRLAHVVMLLFWAGAGVFAARELRRTHGARVATVCFVVFLLFARRYVGFVQSEGLGAPLGAIAFGLLWRAAHLERAGEPWEATFLGGLGLQALALLARPGPMLLLAGLAVWATLRGGRRMLAKAIAVVGATWALHALIRATTSAAPAFSDALAIGYGLLHGEDSRFLFAQHPWIHDPPDPSQLSAVLGIFRSELAARPWLVLVAPVRCLASWFVLPQGFFGFVWLNPDDAAFASDPVRLGAYRVVNVVVMGLAAVVFVGALVRALVRGRRQRGIEHRALAALLVNLAILPPWITEGAQICAAAYLWVVAFVVVSVVPAGGVTAARPLPRVAPAVVAVLGALVAMAKLSPVRLDGACVEGRVLADVDRRNGVVLDGTREANLALVARNNPHVAEAIRASSARRLFPAYDGCRGLLFYVLDAGDTTLVRRMWLTLAPAGDPTLQTATAISPAP